LPEAAFSALFVMPFSPSSFLSSPSMPLSAIA
jgi:hypothetical protein